MGCCLPRSSTASPTLSHSRLTGLRVRHHMMYGPRVIWRQSLASFPCLPATPLPFLLLLLVFLVPFPPSPASGRVQVMHEERH